MAFDIQNFFDGLSRDWNVFDERNAVNVALNPLNRANPLNRGATALGNSLGSVETAFNGGVTAADNGPWNRQEINELITFARSQGLNDGQIGELVDQIAGAQGRGQNALSRDMARQFIAQKQNDNKLQGLMDAGDADLATYTGDLDRQEAEEFGNLQAQGARFDRLLKDPSQIKTDAEYGHMLRQAEQTLQASRAVARNNAASISASRGGGFSGAGLGMVQRADSDATRNYTNTESGFFSDIVGRKDALDRYMPERRQSYSTARSNARTANAGFKSNLTGSQIGANTDYYQRQYGDSIAPRMLQQSESERALQQYVMNPLQQGVSTLTGIASNGVNQIGGLVKK